MIQLGINDYQYQQNAQPSFGSFSGSRGQRIQQGGISQGVGGANPVNNPYAAGNDNSLVGKLDKIDSQTIAPNTKNEIQGQRLYCFG